MQRFAWSIFAAAVVAAATVILATQGQLPATVATHFARGGQPNGWMSHDLYTLVMVALAIGAPLAIVAATTWLPRVAPSLLKLDKCKRWADPAARPAILASTRTFGALAGAMIAAFVAALHLLVVGAHERVPVQLDNAWFITLAVTFAVALVVACMLHTIQTRRA
ncbi:MAG: DUF1648 domain-containing protein [Vicinamibacteria bacterium]|jgi:hypothetical protein